MENKKATKKIMMHIEKRVILHFFFVIGIRSTSDASDRPVDVNDYYFFTLQMTVAV